MTQESDHAEQGTRASLQALIDTSPVGLIVVEASTGKFVLVNEEAQRLLADTDSPGTALEDLMPHLTFRRRDGREIPIEDLPLVRALRTGETVRGEEVVFHLPDGQSVPTIINAAPIFSEEGEITAVVVAFHDMTRFEEMERLRSQFLNMVSQELLSALTSIRDTAVVALDSSRELDAAGLRRLFRTIDEQADHMQSLISDLLDMAQTQSDAL